jgi:subtilisin family serine protease
MLRRETARAMGIMVAGWLFLGACGGSGTDIGTPGGGEQIGKNGSGPGTSGSPGLSAPTGSKTNAGGSVTGAAGTIFPIKSNASQPTPTRVIVKLRGAPDQSLVATAQPSIGEVDMVSAASVSVELGTLLRAHGVQMVRPLSTARMRERLQKAMTDFQIGAATRQRFAARAARAPATAAMPDLAGIYIFDLGTRTAAQMKQTIESLQADPNVIYAEPDYVRRAWFVPNDPSYSTSGSWGQNYPDLWGLKKIGTTAAWDTTRGQGTVVAVVDTGIDYNHPDIQANVWTNPHEIAGNGIDDDHNGYVDDVRGWDFIGPNAQTPEPDNDPFDGFGHGTHVAGTIAATGNNNLGVVGVAWRAKVMALKGLDDSGGGTDSSLSTAIIYAADQGADVINASWGGPGVSQTITDAVNYAHSLGAVFVAAAGNQAMDVNDFSPPNLPNAIAVSALSPPGGNALSSFSNFGNKVELAAPGEDILSLEAGTGGYVRFDGTSVAAPHVSGVAALVIAQHPTFSTDEVRQVLRVAATNLGIAGKDDSFGYGRLNAAQAVLVNHVLAPKLSSPANDADVGIIPAVITGSAQGSGFRNYILDFGSGSSPTSWTVLRNSTTPVASGTLGTFNPPGLTEGTYAFRLRAFDTAGAAFIDEAVVAVRFARITSPPVSAAGSPEQEVRPGLPVTISGIAAGPGFQRYRLEWAPGTNAISGFSSSGFVLTGGGTQPIVNGVLGTWTTPTNLAQGNYTIRLVVTGNATREAKSIIYAEPALISAAWPKLVVNAGVQHAALPVRQPDGSTRFVLCENTDDFPNVDTSCSLYAKDGSVVRVDFVPHTGIGYAGTTPQPAVGNLDGQVGDEIVVPDQFDIKIYSSTFALKRTISNGTTTRFFGLYPLRLIDLDKDGTPEIVTLSQGIISFEDDPSTAADYLYVYKADGTLYSSNYPALIPQTGFGSSSFTAIDLNGTGRKEIVVSLQNPDLGTHSLIAFNANGTPFAGWPSRTYDSNIQGLWAADLDGNGVNELIITEIGQDGRKLRVVEPTGANRAGFPVALPFNYLRGERLAIGDLDRDGRKEIVVPNDHSLMVFRANGTSFGPAWPMAGIFGTAVIADIDNDGFAEIITCSTTTPTPLDDPQPPPPYEARLTAYRRNGTVLKQWPLFGMNNLFPGAAVPTVGEFTGDDKTDIMVSLPLTRDPRSGISSNNSLVYLTAGTTYNAAASDWPINERDPGDSNMLP